MYTVSSKDIVTMYTVSSKDIVTMYNVSKGAPLHQHAYELYSHVLAHWMKARIQIESLVGRKQGEPFPTLELEKEVVGAIVMSMGHNPLSTNPEIDLQW